MRGVDGHVAAVRAAAVEAHVLHERTPGAHREAPGEEERGVPTDGPRVVDAGYLAAEHPREAVGAVEVEAAGQAARLELEEQVGAVGVEEAPGAVPRAPPPRADPADKESRGQHRVARKLASIDVTDALIVTIDGERVVHEFEEMGRHDKVVFKDDDAAVLPDTLRHAVDDAGVVQLVADDRVLVGEQRLGVRVDVEGAPSGKDAAAERLDAVARMLRPVVDKEQDGGKGQCFHPRFMLRVERTSPIRCGHP